MKKSNKIILALALLVFALFTATDLALYAKYKKGDFITQAQLDESNNNSKQLDKFNTISIENCNGISLVPSDSFLLRTNRNDRTEMSYTVKDGTLYIKPAGKYSGERAYANATIFCPSSINLSLNNSDMGLGEQGWKWINAHAVASGLYINATIDSLTVVADNDSEIHLQDDGIVRKLNLQLNQKSRFTMDQGHLEEIGMVNLSDSSRLEVDGKTLKTFIEKNNH
jgi:hypothetical protein